MAIAGELAEARLGEPRRHDAGGNDLHDLPRVAADVVVGEEVERSDTAWRMASGAVAVDEGGDVAREGGRGGGGVGGARGGGGGLGPGGGTRGFWPGEGPW